MSHTMKTLKTITITRPLAVLALSTLAVIAAEPVAITEAQGRKAALAKAEPEYPAMARQMKVAGRVQLQALVDPDGNVVKTEVLEGHALLGSACSNAVKKWKFKPFSDEGKSASALVKLSFDFRM
ncbi:MAG: energy transducer TonB [Acidobacteria bacterium]|nr:energy transducer TonB [Acidobacteriota bacterium]